ncbi:Huntingtin-interacting K protein [Rutstroemia sp. NJR-2017a BBW]|nr:Huntingtin-interacting K protein [Rutstroemia sp. NJR-2017a BBW]
MAEAQPPTIVEGATTGDVDDEIPQAAKSAEDRKAAAALSSLDAPRDDDSTSTKDVDQEAVRQAMNRLAGTNATNGTVAKKEDDKKVVKKTVKVDPADVTLLIDELELTKIKATDLLKAHDGDAEKALRAYIAPVA